MSLLFVPFLVLLLADPQVKTGPRHDGPVILDPDHPADSLGEPVYTLRDEVHASIEQVPGTFTEPKLLKQVNPKLPKNTKTHIFHPGYGLVACVVTKSGDVVDAVAIAGKDAALDRAAVDAVSQYRFAPATHDGEPIALRISVQVKFFVF